MTTETQEWYEFNTETVEALLTDGSNPDATYNIEYHFASDDFDRLEKAAVDAFKAGFEVGDAEELILDDGGTILCFDATVDRQLKLESINQDTDVLLAIAAKHNVHFDGWGTHFIE
ncbi:ribonuclease E inhibitor RraB [Alteromonadaceae bacterium BrNp21-10]|nr:ribonuclease E inhibitor RraB [Alteromonadaceae bacterium BrNp21-10]